MARSVARGLIKGINVLVGTMSIGFSAIDFSHMFETQVIGNRNC